MGQEHVSKTLKNALQSDHLAHAFLFCGPRGVGKTTCARILAKILNCQALTPEHEPCNSCSSCTSFNENASFNITELDAASNNSVEHIRALIEQVRFQPQQGKYKVFIIDEVHMLSAQAFNAFLKTLEEPPSYAVFILATTEKHKIIPTILSRCQIFDFRRIQVHDMVSHLQGICDSEGIQADPDALHIIGQKADGALRDALSIFDRIVAASGKTVTYADVIENLNILDYDYYFRVVDALLSEDVSQLLLIFDDILRKGFDADVFINGLAEHLRNLLVTKDAQTLALLDVGANLKERFMLQARISPVPFLLTALNLANSCDIEYKMARNKRLHVEMTLIKMAYMGRAVLPQPQATIGEPEKKNPDLTSHPLEAASYPHLSAPAALVEEDTPPQSLTASVETTQAAETAPKVPAHQMKQINMKDLLNQATSPAMSEETAAGDEPVNEEDLAAHWLSYADTVDSEAFRALLKATLPVVEEERFVVVSVGSSVAESLIRSDSNFLPWLRKKLRHKNLEFRIRREERKTEDMPKPQRPLTAKEKFMKMRDINPEIHQLMERFALRPDED